MHPPRTGWHLFYFVPGTSANMKNGCHHHQIGMDSLCDVIFKMADIEFGKFSFSHISASRIGREEILVAKYIFQRMRNPLVPLLKLYDYWFSWQASYPKWRTSKSGKIGLLCISQLPSPNHTAYFVRDLVTEKSNMEESGQRSHHTQG